MNRTRLFLFTLSAILFSCNEDEDPMPTSKAMLGTWSVTAISYKGSTTTTVSGISIKADFTGTGKDMDLTTTFGENPNTVTSEGSYTIVLTTTMLGQTTTEEYPFDEAVIDGTWTLEGRTLTITNGAITQDATITRQTNTVLEVKIKIEETESDPNFTVTTKVDAVYTFEKQD